MKPVETASSECPLCGAAAFRTVKSFADGVVVGECAGCRLLYTPRRHPCPETLLEATSLADLRALLRPLRDGMRRHFRHRSFRFVLDAVARHAPGRRLLDVGCAHGFFPAMARAAGYQVTGIEPVQQLADYARQELGLEVLGGRAADVELGDRSWDAVTFSDSLEYLVTPVADLQRLLAHLAPRGVLVAKVPNGDYCRLRHTVESHIGTALIQDEPFSPSRRFAHYTLSSLRRLATAAGLEPVETGAAPVIDSPVWESLVGLSLQVEMPWYLGVRQKVLRRALRGCGLVEQALWPGHDHFSPSIYLVGRKPG